MRQQAASIESNIQFGQHPARADSHIAHFIAALNAGQYEQDNEGRLWTQVKIAYVFPKTSARSKKVVWTNKMFNEDIMYDATGNVTYNNLPAQSKVVQVKVTPHAHKKVDLNQPEDYEDLAAEMDDGKKEALKKYIDGNIYTPASAIILMQLVAKGTEKEVGVDMAVNTPPRTLRMNFMMAVAAKDGDTLG